MVRARPVLLSTVVKTVLQIVVYIQITCAKAVHPLTNGAVVQQVAVHI